MRVPLTRKSTLVTPILSDAVAVSVTFALLATVAPFKGFVIETVGGMESVGRGVGVGDGIGVLVGSGVAVGVMIIVT